MRQKLQVTRGHEDTKDVSIFGNTIWPVELVRMEVEQSSDSTSRRGLGWVCVHEDRRSRIRNQPHYQTASNRPRGHRDEAEKLQYIILGLAPLIKFLILYNIYLMMALKSFSSFQILCSVLLLALVTATEAAPNAVITKATTPPASKTTTVPSPTPTACGFRGDDNTYGLGMRLGIYLQWFAAWIAYAWVPSEVVTMRALNKYFLLSNFIGLLYITFSQGANQPSGQLYAVECWIVLTFCLGGILTGSTLFETSRSSLLDSIIRVALINATTFYAVWFIYVGMDTMLAPTCSRSVFFYAKVDLFHWFRILCKCLINIGAIFAAWWAVELCLRIIKMVRTGRMEPKEPNEESQRYGWRHAGLSHVLVLFIVSTELTLVWNNTHGINTIRGTAQILPVVVAGIGMIRVLWKAIVKRWSSATP